MNKGSMKILVPYLDNSFEEAIFENYQIKGQHETMKLQNEKVKLKNRNLNNELNKPVHE